MGDMIGGAASGGKSASAAEAGGGGADIAGADPSGGLGGIDPSFGMGAAGWDPSGGGGMGSDFGSFPGQIPGDPAGSLRAPQPPITDQPSATPPPTQQPQAPPQQPQQYGSASEALFKGLMDKEDPGLSSTPGGQQFASLSTANDASKADAWAPQQNTNLAQVGLKPGVNFEAIDPSQSTGAYAQPSGVKFDAIQPNLKPGVNFEAIDPSQSTGAYSRQNLSSVSATNANQPAAVATRGFEPPTVDPNISSDSSSIGGGGPASTLSSPPPATPPVSAPGLTTAGITAGGAPTGGTAPGIGTGMGMHSPLEQLVGQVIHMLLGGLGGRGGIGSILEQMIDRALGINPRRMFPQYYGGGFNPPAPAPGSGYFPAGTAGGRAVSPGSQPGAPPLPQPKPPGTPGTPGNPPSALPPGRRIEDHPEAPDGTASPGAKQAGAGGGIAGVPGQVAQLARQWAMKGGPGAVFDFMRQQGFPRSGSWCGEFAAAVMHSQGLPVPQGNPAVASNWRTWGNPTRNPQPGDIAVRKGVPTGQTGSHVSTVKSFDPVSRKVTLTGGNQGMRGPYGRSLSTDIYPANTYDFRTMRSSTDQIRAIRYQPEAAY